MVSVIERNNDQMRRAQFIFVVGIIDCELCILWSNQINLINGQQEAIIDIDANELIFIGKELGVRITKLLIASELIFSIYKKTLLIIQCRDVFVI